MGLLDRLGARRIDGLLSLPSGGTAAVPAFPTRALRKFLTSLTSRETPILLDLGPVVGNNVSFFGEQLGCKIFVEDMYAEIDHFATAGTLDALPEYLATRFSQPDGSVDGVLCWDVVDYLPRPAAQVLAAQLTRVLRPEGALLALFGTTQPNGTPRYTKFVVNDEASLVYREYPAVKAREATLLSRDILKLFGGLHVADSFLLKNNIRELLFRKPA